MKAYSEDLRERVSVALNSGEQAQSAIAERFGVSPSFVERLSRRLRQTRSWAALPHGGGKARTLQPYGAWLRAQIAEQSDVTLEELCERVHQTHGVPASPSMMCRELQRLHLPRKKSRSTTASGRRPG